MSQSARLSVLPTTENVRLIGTCAGAFAASVLEADEAARVELCIVEAVNNVVEHGYGGGDSAGEEMHVEFQIDHDELVVVIKDGGKPAPASLFTGEAELVFDPENLDSLPEGGMGLFIIQEVMDDVQYVSDEGFNVLTLTRKVARDS